MKFILVSVVCASFLSLVSGGYLAKKHSLRFRRIQRGNGNNMEWFQQYLDHFDPTNPVKWLQRYEVYDGDFKNTADSPVFLFINGESEMYSGFPGAFVSYAERYGALCFQLEHRFYGKSQPTGDLSVGSLRYLSSEQALADVAYFIDRMTQKYSLSEKKWIVFGGSYAGALAAWARLKYPHLIQAAVSSSGPVLAQLNFEGYNEVVRESLAASSSLCAKNVHLAALQVEDALRKPDMVQEISKKFQLCTELNVTNPNDISEFLYTSAANIAGTVQYNNEELFEVDDLCEIMIDPSVDLIDRYAAAFKQYMLLEEKCNDVLYDENILAMKNEMAGNDYRSWVYQTCTEFGFFVTSSSRSELFGSGIDVQFFIDTCTAVFGSDFDRSRVVTGIHRTNVKYGQLNIVDHVTNVIFVQGSLDPWHVLGVNNSTNSDSPAIIIEGAAHCANMGTPRANDSAQLVEARRKIVEFLERVLTT